LLIKNKNKTFTKDCFAPQNTRSRRGDQATKSKEEIKPPDQEEDQRPRSTCRRGEGTIVQNKQTSRDWNSKPYSLIQGIPVALSPLKVETESQTHILL